MQPRALFASDAEYLAYLRDWFAGQWLMGSSASGVAAEPAEFAEEAYQIADAMLTLRAKATTVIAIKEGGGS